MVTFKNGIVTSQCKYSRNLLEETEKSVDNPIEQNHGLQSHIGELLHDPKSYETLVEK